MSQLKSDLAEHDVSGFKVRVGYFNSRAIQSLQTLHQTFAGLFKQVIFSINDRFSDQDFKFLNSSFASKKFNLENVELVLEIKKSRDFFHAVS